MFFEKIEVMIAMKQRVALRDTKSRDETVYRLANSVPAGSQRAVVLGRCYRKFLSDAWEDSKIGQNLTNALEIPLFTNTLQNYAEDQIRQAETIAIKLTIEPLGMSVSGPVEIIDPY